MKAVYALYPDGDAAQEAVNGLRAEGFADRDITILSSRPMEDHEFGEMGKATWMWWIACGGGLVGMTIAFVTAWVAETSWPMNVGGLPAFAWWPNLIIIFELTMLGAIVATAIALVVTAGLARSGDKLYDPAVSDGKILVGVVSPPDSSMDGVERALTAPKGAELRRVEPIARATAE